MSPPLVGLALAIAVGGVAAMAARDPRIAVLGAAAVCLLAPLLRGSFADPFPLVARLGAAVIAIVLLGVALRAEVRTRGSAIGWPAEALVAGAAAIVGAAVGEARPAAAGPGGGGAPEALVGGLALGAVTIGPLLRGRDALRLGLAALLATHAAVLVRGALVGDPSPLDDLAMASLVVTLGAATAALCAAVVRATGRLELVGARRPGPRADAAAGPASGTPDARTEGARRPGGR